MIKVCHMTSAHGKEDNRIFNKECVSLAASGYDVYLVQRGESYDKNGVHIIGAGFIPEERWKRMTKGAKQVFEIGKSLDCDLYHIHDPELLPFALKLHKMGKKVVFDSHELYREQLKMKTKIGPLLAYWYSKYEKKVLPQIDGVIFPCPINGYNPYEGMYNKFAYVNNVPLMTELYDKYVHSESREENTVCYIGNITRARGITNLIKAASKAGVKLYLAGICHNQEYMNEIQKMPEFSNVEYLGILDRNGIVDLLKKTKVGMATLLNVGQYNQADNLPTKVYEYMAMGIPSIISKTPYNETILKVHQFGIAVNPDNVQEIEQAIRSILSDNDSYEIMSANARKAIANQYNWELEVENLKGLYEKVLE